MGSNRTMNDLARSYYQLKDRNRLAEGIWGMVAQISRKLAIDPDIAGDYCLHIYEKLDHCMKVYKTRRAIPFRAFLLRYLRNEYKNFTRLKVRRMPEEIMYKQLTWIIDERPECVLYSPYRIKPSTKYHSFHRALHDLSDKHRIALKLYGGMELNLKELRLLIQNTGCSNRAAQFLLDKRKKKEGQTGDPYYPNRRLPAKQSGIELKKQASMMSSSSRSVKSCAMSRLSRLLGVNRSTMSRHLHEAVRHLDSKVDFFEKQSAV